MKKKKKKKKKRKKSLCPEYIYNLIQTIGLSECNNIRKKLNNDHSGKVPSKVASS